MDNEKLKKFRKMIDESRNIVFFGGAGVSTESGIPDFRGRDGLYNQKYDRNPEYMLSLACFKNEPDLFWKFYRDKILAQGVKPNKAHFALRELEKRGKLKAIVTQNIDNLHEEAGSKNVYHIHGSILTYHCPKCGDTYILEEIMGIDETPICYCGQPTNNGIVLKPDITLYGEKLPEEEWNKSVLAIHNADMMIVAGTSLKVFPAAGLISEFSGKYLVIINRDKTQADSYADLVFHDSIGEVLDAAIQETT